MVKLQTRPLLQRTRLRRVRLEAGTLPPRPRNFRITIFMSRTQQTLMLKPHYMSFAECENARLLTEPCRMAPACRGTVARLQEVFESRNTIHSLLMICPTDPPQQQKIRKIPKKIPSKGHPRACTLWMICWSLSENSSTQRLPAQASTVPYVAMGSPTSTAASHGERSEGW